MPLRINPISGDLDLVGDPGAGGDATNLTGDVGAAVTPDGSDSISLIGDATQAFIETTGTPASNKMEIKLLEPAANGELLIGHTANAEPSVTTLTGGVGITVTNGAGSITIAATSSDDLVMPTDSGTGTAVAGSMDLLGSTGISTSASGNTITITADVDVPTSFTTDSGTGTPSSNTLAVNGGTGINTSGVGAGITVNLDNPVIAAQGGSGRQSHTSYAVLCGGTTSTSAQQSIASVGSANEVLTSNGASALPTFQAPATSGDVTAGSNLTDNAIIRGAGGSKGIQDSSILIDDSDNITGVVTLGMAGDLTDYEDVNDGSPEIRLGSSDTEELHIQSVYDGGAKTIDHVLFQTDVASGTADKGLFRFNVDNTDIVDIDDDGLDLKSGRGLSVAGTEILNASTLGSGVTASSLTSVGTIATGVWNGTAVAELYGGTGQSGFTKGDILYASATNTLSKLAIGSDGQVLTVATDVPSWDAAIGGSGAWVWLASTTASASSSVEFDNTIITSTYNHYHITIRNLNGATNDQGLKLLFSNDNGDTFETTNYNSGFDSDADSRQATTGVLLSNTGSNGLGTDTGEGYYNGEIDIYQPADASQYTGVQGTGYYIPGSAAKRFAFGTGTSYQVNETVNAIQIIMDSGNIANGEIVVYGIKES